MIRAPQRKFNLESLESWFGYLQQPWEKTFDAQAVRLGRHLYRAGDIRSVELGPDFAIVSAKEGKTELYSVIEWKESGPDVRGSTDDDRIGHGLAVAGLYEIEELIADELPLLEPKVDDADKKAAEERDAELERNRQRSGGTGLPAGPTRRMRVQLSIDTMGVLLRAEWRNPDGSLANAFVAPPRSSGERESLIRLTSRAHRNEFRFRPSRGDYLLRDLTRIPLFVRNEAPRWQRFFDLELDARLQHFRGGLQEVEVVFDARENRGRLEASWDFLVNGLPLSAEERSQILSGRGRTLILPERGLVQLPGRTLDLLREWQPILKENGTGLVPHYMLFSLFGQDDVRIRETRRVREWRRQLESGLPPVPDLPAFLRPYQKSGVRWLFNLLQLGGHPLLADEMGLGKTVQVLALIDLARRTDQQLPDTPAMIVAPASVVPVWQNEVQRFFPHLTTGVISSDDGPAERASGVDVWISSYTQLRRRRQSVSDLEFSFVILDEAQFIKNPDAKVTQACLSVQAKYRIALTGTPLENRQLDLWTIYRFLMPGLLGSRGRLNEELKRDAEGTMLKLRRQIRPFFLRRTKTEVARDLPEKMELPLVCALSPAQRREYIKLVDRAENDVGDNLATAMRQRSMTVLSLLTRLRQTCCCVSLLPWMSRHTDAGGKIEALMTRLSDVVNSGRKAVVFSQFVRFLDRIETELNERFPDLPVHHLRGSTRDRSKPVEAFQTSEGGGVMLVSLKAGGTGITLHAAEYVFLMDPWWNPAVEAQAVDRVHRIGQTNRVFVYRLVTAGTVEERIESLKQHKRELFDALLGGMQGVQGVAGQFESLRSLIEYRPSGYDEDADSEE